MMSGAFLSDGGDGLTAAAAVPGGGGTDDCLNGDSSSPHVNIGGNSHVQDYYYLINTRLTSGPSEGQTSDGVEGGVDGGGSGVVEGGVGGGVEELYRQGRDPLMSLEQPPAVERLAGLTHAPLSSWTIGPEFDLEAALETTADAVPWERWPSRLSSLSSFLDSLP
jgi:hypothetical protein